MRKLFEIGGLVAAVARLAVGAISQARYFAEAISNRPKLCCQPVSIGVAFSHS